MRTLGLACVAFLFVGMPLSAQNAAPARAPVPQTPERRDQLLAAWEKRMLGVDSLSTAIIRTELHELTKKATIYVGDAAFMRPNLARINLTHQDEVGKKDSEKTNFERFCCNGRAIYEFSPTQKLVVVHALPNNDPAGGNTVLGLLRGLRAADLTRRFDVTLTEEEWYAHLRLTPKFPADRQDFSRVDLAIWLKNPNRKGEPDLTLLPCQLWYRQPNGKEVTYRFGKMQPNARLDKDSFTPRLIPGYRFASSSAPPAPMPR